MTELKATSLSK